MAYDRDSPRGRDRRFLSGDRPGDRRDDRRGDRRQPSDRGGQLPRPAPTAPMAAGVRTGTFARRVADKGFGFIVDDLSGVDVFFHTSDYRPVAGNPRFEDLGCHPATGSKLIFEAEETGKGWRARKVYAR